MAVLLIGTAGADTKGTNCYHRNLAGFGAADRTPPHMKTARLKTTRGPFTNRATLIAPITLLPAALLVASPALAQENPEADPAPEPSSQAVIEAGEEAAIVVTAERLLGRIDAPQQPIAEFNEADIASFGASSFTEVLEAIAPEAASGRGRGGGQPVVLVNGQRISSFRELRDYPPEAIQRIEVLPEEIALRYGYRANQRVVNFILKDNFSSMTVEAEYGVPGSGGFHSGEVEAGLVRISGSNRLNLKLEATDSSALTEAERGLVQPAGAAPRLAADADPADFRTLIADSRDLSFNGGFSTALGEGARAGALSLNAALTREDSRSLSGLDSAVLTAPDGSSVLRSFHLPEAGFDPRERDQRTITAQTGGSYDQPLGDWRLTATGDWTHTDTRTLIDRRADASALADAAAAGVLAIDAPLAELLASGLVSDGRRDRAETRSDAVTSLVTLAGAPVLLPAGEIALTLSASYDWTGIESRDSRNTGSPADLTRGDAGAAFTVGVPIASRRAGVLDVIGDLSIDLSAGINHLSDFGTLTNWTAGLNWGVTERLSLQLSRIVSEEAPGLTQLGAARIVNLDTTVYDFATGQTVLVNTIEGGNPNLREETQRDWKLGLTWDLPVLDRSTLLVEFFRNNSSDVTSDFPLLTPTIEAAFPGRVTRDQNGQLLAIDQRPVTFDTVRSSSVRYGLSLGDSFGGDNRTGGNQRGDDPPRRGADASAGEGDRGERSAARREPGRGSGGGRGGGRGFGPGRGGRGGDGGRWNLSLYHTVRFDESVRIAPGGPLLDLLDGEALSGGGTPRHEIEMRGGVYYKGFGLRLSGGYLGASTIEGSALPGSGALRFHPIATFNARLFADLGRQERLVESAPFFENSRISLRVDNIFAAQQRVTDDTGMVPLRYQPGFTDPQGRFFEIDFRKMF